MRRGCDASSGLVTFNRIASTRGPLTATKLCMADFRHTRLAILAIIPRHLLLIADAIELKTRRGLSLVQLAFSPNSWRPSFVIIFSMSETSMYSWSLAFTALLSTAP